MRLPAFGERGIYLVESLDRHAVHPLRGWGQGHFILRDDAPGGKRSVYNSTGRAVTGIAPVSLARATRFDAYTAAGVQLAKANDPTDHSEPLLESKTFKAYIRRMAAP